ncbi:MAG: tRNA (N(6)-L-threonylcarbamoyladenosine(37)-C(2))-methylthiotransferase MtaB [Defluviitaleaceae bacterium]|nr:tRNA (N(6)-L-threonylcarbamoyladenosine(37)-C(2))-methylthiotransferase MtaB [Defluviitaleaceae bacterium]
MAVTFSLHTLGCKVNQCDADALAAVLRENGYIHAPDRISPPTPQGGRRPPTDIYVINTCTVTKTVDKKSLQAIRRARRANPDAFIAVCGCMAKNDGAVGLRKSGFVDCVFDTRRPQDLLAALGERFGNRRIKANIGADNKAEIDLDGIHRNYDRGNSARTRAFLKVQDGCDRFCAYCIVPYVRGGLKSEPPKEILRQITALTGQGAKEIVLTGIQLSSYGKDTGDVSLPELIRAIAAHEPELKRLRLSSLDPWAINGDFLQAVAATPVLCDHFHLSLQSGCDATLARMNRGYTAADYAKTVDALRKVRPQAAITTDMIVGFPGESGADFAESVSFAKTMGFARIHVFPYSPREGTKAARMSGQVSPAEKDIRGKRMLAAAEELKERFLAAQVGAAREVLFETPRQGHTRNYCMVRIPVPTRPNTLANVHITGHDRDGLKGELIC